MNRALPYVIPFAVLAVCGGKPPESAAAPAAPPPLAARAAAATVEPAAATVEPAAAIAGFDPYRESLPGSDVAFAMVPIRGGTFTMGSSPDAPGHEPDEAPPVEVTVEPFWMGAHEVTWAEYDLWNADAERPQSKQPDGIARPTPPYMDMTFNMGRDGYPAICMSHVAARQYCKWLSAKTGRFYRLPTEAEWEFACRAGSRAAWSFGDDVGKLGDHAWFVDNSARVLEPGAPPVPAYHPVGKKAANAFGLFDMHGNVAEWVADHYLPDAYAEAHGKAPRSSPYQVPPKDQRGRPVRFPHVLRGGSWRDPAPKLRSAAREPSDPVWNERDPQIPKSWWYLTEGQHVGFRVVRPLREPTAEERAKFESP